MWPGSKEDQMFVRFKIVPLLLLALFARRSALWVESSEEDPLLEETSPQVWSVDLSEAGFGLTFTPNDDLRSDPYVDFLGI
ncbi:MAG: hypothetical protein U5L75_03375 [Candidatus Campbellbacteria bacterium]|nr:hypothetical protein [Candidatus Campbellbacteria bacterium]